MSLPVRTPRQINPPTAHREREITAALSAVAVAVRRLLATVPRSNQVSVADGFGESPSIIQGISLL